MSGNIVIHILSIIPSAHNLASILNPSTVKNAEHKMLSASVISEILDCYRMSHTENASIRML